MNSPRLQVYVLFHLNLAYSSIGEEQRSAVVKCCYWPLLHLARDAGFPLAIEASAFTLETAATIDPDWMAELRRLVHEGQCEFVGSGYSQLIGPLVPAEVNAANLRLGNEAYERLLGCRPQVALVNEQAYSAGIVGHYLDAGYRAIVMEWNNPARYHVEWDAEWRYLPQYACALDGRKIPLIWNNSIFFQKFQRYAHGEMELDEYCRFIHAHCSESARVFPLYGNDVEVFDFRPGRYQTEAELHGEGEWRRISALFATLLADETLQLVMPSAVLQLLDEPGAGQVLRLESPEDPVPVKKQEKYNSSRWAVTGRDDLGINTVCWRIYDALSRSDSASESQWRELCYLWSSDFRTHITEERWLDYRERLRAFAKLVTAESRVSIQNFQASRSSETKVLAPGVRVERVGHILEVETKTVGIRLNCRRGLAIDAIWFKDISDTPLCGTLPHGYYDDISLGADFYTGHLVLETPAQYRITDLLPVSPTVRRVNDVCLEVSATVTTPIGEIEKLVRVNDGKVSLTSRLNWQELPLGSLRLFAVTLNPQAFEKSSLFFRTHNGGFGAETFLMNNKQVNHGGAASFLVSSKQVLGCTEGGVDLGDEKKFLRLTVDKLSSALVGFITFRPVGETYFARCSFSANEMDETSRPKRLLEPLVCSLTMSAV